MRPLATTCCAVIVAWASGAAAQHRVDAFRLGVQTHFEQGWSTDLIETAKRLGAPAVRDEIGWSEVETAPGVYDFSVADAYMHPLIRAGIMPFIVINDTNPLYDGGKTPHSTDGRAAFARYVSAILSHYGADAVRIEIGNEVNSGDFVNGPFATDQPRYFAATVRAVKERLQQDHPQAGIICSGLNTVAIGFYRSFFRRGGLVACDAISVHPYRDNPDSLMGDLARLRALMREYGGEKPIYVTEFGNWFENPDNAPDYMVKMVTQLAAAGVEEAYWYALLDEEWWPNMGLMDRGGKARKPAAETFQMLQTRLIPLGRPRTLSDDATVRVFEFGTSGEAYVLWGSGATVAITGAASFLDTRGRDIAPVTRLTDSPVIVVGRGIEVQVAASEIVADSLYQYGQPPWSYYALRPDIGLVPLEIIDWDWTSYRGAPDLSPLAVRDDWITTARFGDKPYHAIERFTARAGGRYRVSGWWEASPKTEASQLLIRHNRQTISQATITPDRFSLSGVSLQLAPGDTVDFEIAPGGPGGNGSVRRRIQIAGPLTGG
ncbi:glycosyl hydrolase [Sulfitobacter sabulilitoris]|uniref:Asl1-like glycosyl hydrolase catalytic domain-containing protein n=1 Tax=Sulfitobacter sabulilitoris TaxID=2562655 RepID=A0A5S3PDM7_9RHOB|nr:glycosyl hydrolase [Sulfitobacter sabulilitoris]TMM51059.1 hypothetical protein FDT80_14405 [Sulfitobacter sabulilitoris]